MALVWRDLTRVPDLVELRNNCELGTQCSGKQQAFPTAEPLSCPHIVIIKTLFLSFTYLRHVNEHELYTI